MKQKQKLTLSDYREMYELERKFYGEEHITPYQEAYRWHLVHPGHCRAMEDRGRIVAFVDMFPIQDAVYQQLMAGNFNDRDLTEEGLLQLEGEKPCLAQMFLCCVVVEKEYRRTGALLELLQAHLDFYQHYQEQGFRFQWIVTDNVTQDGERFSRRMGFERIGETSYGTVLYRMPYAAFLKTVSTMQELKSV